MPGTFVFRPLEANLTHNTDLITKMNPYCSFIIGDQKFNSNICKKGGKHPVWNEIVSIPASAESNLILEIMDKDRITKDDVIGGCSINLREIENKGMMKNWYPLFYKNKPAGEILLETSFEGGNFINNNAMELENETILNRELHEKELLAKERLHNDKMIIENENPTKIFTEQHQVVEPHTFMKNVDVVETIPVEKQIEVMEPHKVLKEVEYTQAVPVKKEIEVVEPIVVTKEIETVEPKLVTKTIQVVENVPVKKQVEVIEMQHHTKEVETMEPQTFTKQVEVIEQEPVMKTVQVNEPITVSKAVEFVEPVITTQTITKEVHQPVVVNETFQTEVGPATLIGVEKQGLIKEKALIAGEMKHEMCKEHRMMNCNEKRCLGMRNDKNLL